MCHIKVGSTRGHGANGDRRCTQKNSKGERVFEKCEDEKKFWESANVSEILLSVDVIADLPPLL